MLDIKDYMAGYSAGSGATEMFDEREVPDPNFEQHSALYRKGWWDGFNKLEFDPGGQGLFSDPSHASGH
jgi:hypothetical protein